MKIEAIENLVKLFAKLPGLGPRSARRIVLHLIKHPDNLMAKIADSIITVSNEIKKCTNCGNLDVISPCNICSDQERDHETICVVEDVTDLWAIERGMNFKGTYHVLGGVLSALDGITPNKLNISTLRERVSNSNIKEVIIATNATLEGETTGHYLYETLKGLNIKTTRLAHGIPVGAELDYMDEGTLTLAIRMRQEF